MKYQLLQQRLKPYKQGGYTDVRLNAKKVALEAEYDRLLKLDLSQDQLEQSIANREVDRVNAIDPLAAYANPDRYTLKHIRARVLHLAQVSTINELRQNYPLVQERNFNFRYKTSWIDCLRLIGEITEQSRLNEEFREAVERAIEIELKSIEDDFYRHETPDPDLYTVLSDNRLIGSAWEGNGSTLSLLKRAYVLSRCRDAGLDPREYLLV